MPSNCKYRDYNITIGDLPFLETVDGFFCFFFRHDYDHSYITVTML